MKTHNSRLKKAYVTAWNFSDAFGEPLWLQWLWRVIIFGAPLFFIAMSIMYGITTSNGMVATLLVTFVLSSHPIVTAFIYHDFYEVVIKRDENDDGLS